MANSTIVLTGGGTAGHVVPNLALIPLLEKHFDNIIYIGSDTGPERELTAQYKNVTFYPITTVKLIRGLTLKNLLIPFKLLKGKREAKQILKDVQPDIIFSKGGFVAVPVVMAGKKLRIPMIAHESDFSLGLANKITRKDYDIICTSFKDTAESLPNGVYVGSPIKQVLVSQSDKTRIRQQYNLTSNKPICLVIGGSQGAVSINKAVEESLDFILKTHQVLHITGKGKMNSIKKADYHAVEYVENMSALLSIVDIAITRGGSNVLFELLSNQIPMLIIPLSRGSRGDQVQNARYFEQKGYAITLPESQLSKQTLEESFEKLIALSPVIKASTKHAVPSDTLTKICNLINKYRRKQPQT